MLPELADRRIGKPEFLRQRRRDAAPRPLLGRFFAPVHPQQLAAKLPQRVPMLVVGQAER